MDDTPTTRPSLLVRLRNLQDQQSWEEFYAIYQPLVFRLARSQGFQDADASELTQEVFIAVASAIQRWDPNPQRGSFRGWLFRIARNLMINWLTYRRRHPTGAGNSDIHRLLAEQPDPHEPDREDSAVFDREYKRQAFAWAAEQIRNEFRESTWQAFWLTSVENRPVPEAAKELGISAGAVYIARSRVMARLRQKIETLEEK
ncbi:MAG: sigma-70 family RNA polymerase sigma factor [Thermoguttaceae bacterium]|jgi:RNA polymerase sigma-70 factor (ECF subfamily)